VTEKARSELRCCSAHLMAQVFEQSSFPGHCTTWLELRSAGSGMRARTRFLYMAETRESKTLSWLLTWAVTHDSPKVNGGGGGKEKGGGGCQAGSGALVGIHTRGAGRLNLAFLTAFWPHQQNLCSARAQRRLLYLPYSASTSSSKNL